MNHKISRHGISYPKEIGDLVKDKKAKEMPDKDIAQEKEQIKPN